MADKKTDSRIIADNRKARHDYFVIETYEAGIELFGTEVKSLRAGGCNLKDSYCEIDKGELFALGVHISPYEQGNIFNKDPLRSLKACRSAGFFYSSASSQMVFSGQSVVSKWVRMAREKYSSFSHRAGASA